VTRTSKSASRPPGVARKPLRHRGNQVGHESLPDHPHGILLLLFGRRPNQWFKFDPQNLSVKNVLSLLFFAAFGVGYVVKHGW
jgi:hypothetical protein